MKKSQILSLVVISAFSVSCANFSGHKGCGHGKKDRHEKHFKKLDTDGNGSLSVKEWGSKFKSIDTNNDGKLTADEMKAHHKSEKKACHYKGKK